MPGDLLFPLFSVWVIIAYIHLLHLLLIFDIVTSRRLILLLRFGMSLIGALFVLQLYRFVLRETGNEQAALWVFALALLTTPIYFYSIHIYPELIVALLSFLAFRMLRELAAGEDAGAVP